MSCALLQRNGTASVYSCSCRHIHAYVHVHGGIDIIVKASEGLKGGSDVLSTMQCRCYASHTHVFVCVCVCVCVYMCICNHMHNCAAFPEWLRSTCSCSVVGSRGRGASLPHCTLSTSLSPLTILPLSVPPSELVFPVVSVLPFCLLLLTDSSPLPPS